MIEIDTHPIRIDRNAYRPHEWVQFPFETPLVIQNTIDKLQNSQEKNRIINELIVNNKKAEDGTEQRTTTNVSEVIAALFAFKRAEYRQLDREKELRAIAAVINLVQGNCAALDTAAGKSSAILPIAALTLTATTRQAVLLPTSQAALVPDMVANINRLIDQINPAVAEENRDSWKKMVYTTRMDHARTEAKTARQAAQNLISAPVEDELQAREYRGGIFVTTYADLVFYSFEHPEKWGNFPPALGDEVTAPYDSNEAFLQTTQELERPPVPFDGKNEDLAEYTRNYVITRVVHRILTTDRSNFELHKGELQLSPSGLLAVTQIAREIELMLGMEPTVFADNDQDTETIRTRLRVHMSPDKPELTVAFSAVFNEALQEATSYFGQHTTGADAGQIRKTILQQIHTYVSGELFAVQGKSLAREQLLNDKDQTRELSDREYSISPTEEYTLSIAREVARAMNIRKGIDYIDSPRELRDAYTGEFKPQHQFLTDTALTLQAMAGTFDPQGTEQSLRQHMHYATFLSLVLGERIAATDASLIYTNPRTGERIPSPFASVAQTLLHKDVVDLSGDTAPIPIPTPEIAQTRTLINRLIGEIQQRSTSSELVICRNEETAKELARALKEAGIACKTIHALTPEEEMKSIYRELETRALRVVITTGRGSRGKNLEDAALGYPDLHVTEFGMPQSLEQFDQGLRRRRLERADSDFSWFIPLEEAQQWITLLKKHPRREWLIVGSKPTGFERGVALINKSSQGTLQDAEKQELQNLMLYLLEERSKTRRDDSVEMAAYETLWSKEVAPRIAETKKQIFNKEFAESPLQIRLEQFCEAACAPYPCSRELREQIRQRYTETARQWFARFEGSMHLQFFSDCAMHPQLAAMHYEPSQLQERARLIGGIWAKRIEPPTIPADSPKPVSLLKDMDTTFDGEKLNYYKVWQDKLAHPDWQTGQEFEQEMSIVTESVAMQLKFVQDACDAHHIPFERVVGVNNYPAPIAQPDRTQYTNGSTAYIDTARRILAAGVVDESLAHGQDILRSTDASLPFLVSPPTDNPQEFLDLRPLQIAPNGVPRYYFVADGERFNREQDVFLPKAGAETTGSAESETKIRSYRIAYPHNSEQPVTHMIWMHVREPVATT